jgi:AcrR family transcriptional regulator
MATIRPHERILAAATRLFADEGIHATSVDRVIAEAGVAPMTVYRHFAGKDDLVTATLERWSTRWLEWLRGEALLAGDDPAARLEALWDALEKWFADEGFRGSYVVNVATELRAKPGHPAQAVIVAHRAALRQLLQDLVTATGVPLSPAAVLQLQTASPAPPPAPGRWPAAWWPRRRFGPGHVSRPLGRPGYRAATTCRRNGARMQDPTAAAWRTSSLCDLNGCVEVAILDDQVAVRDAKDRAGPVLVFSAAEWEAFVGGVRGGEFDPR